MASLEELYTRESPGGWGLHPRSSELDGMLLEFRDDSALSLEFPQQHDLYLALEPSRAPNLAVVREHQEEVMPSSCAPGMTSTSSPPLIQERRRPISPDRLQRAADLHRETNSRSSAGRRPPVPNQDSRSQQQSVDRQLSTLALHPSGNARSLLPGNATHPYEAGQSSRYPYSDSNEIGRVDWEGFHGVNARRAPNISRSLTVTTRQSSTDIAKIRKLLDKLLGFEDVIPGEDAIQAIKALEGADAEAAINLLDEKLYHMSPEYIRWRMGLKILHRLCIKNQFYPRALAIPPQMLQKVSAEADSFGGSSHVFQGRLRNIGRVAIKMIITARESRSAQRTLERFYGEAVIWRHIRHRNIAMFYGVDTSSGFSLISQWMPLGTVREFLVDRQQTNRIKLLQDIASGLAYLHSLGIVHADMKSGNVLVSSQHVAKLIDFGIATITVDGGAPFTSTTATNCTARWAAPEILDPELFGRDRSKFSPECDIYSLSMTMWELFTGLVPFHKDGDGAMVRKVTSNTRPSYPPRSVALSVGLTDRVWALMERCWNHDSLQRPDINEVLGILSLEDSQSEKHPLTWPLNLDP